jgi:hypothetical protein
MPALVGTPPPSYLGTPEPEAASTEAPEVPETLITFGSKLSNTPTEGLVCLSLLDEDRAGFEYTDQRHGAAPTDREAGRRRSF